MSSKKRKTKKKNKKKNNKKTYIILIVVISILALLGTSMYLFIPRYFEKKTISKLEIGYNTTFTYPYGEVRYGNLIKSKTLKPKIIGEVDTSKIGVYKVKYIFKGGYEFTQEVHVVDKKSPEITLNQDVKICPNGDIKDLNIKAVDEYDGDLTSRVETSVKDNVLYVSVTDSSGNKETATVALKLLNEAGPTIKLNGNSDLVLKVGETYKEQGVKATDLCDGDIEVKASGSVNTKKEGTYKITYVAKNSSGKEAKVERTVKVIQARQASAPNPKNLVGAKVIYLTFDDGPSKHTSRLLDVLKKYNVKATFFVTGYGSDSMIKREYDEGHTIGLHTYTHEYCKVYKNVDAYFADLNKIQNRVKRITGFTPKYIRFPGGSSNTVSKGCDGGKKIMSQLVKEVEKRGYVYFDWNVVSGDAGWTTSTDKVYNYVVKALKANYSIVLQHDSKGYSVDAVERIIKYGLKNGFTFKKIDDSTPVVHHRVSN